MKRSGGQAALIQCQRDKGADRVPVIGERSAKMG